LGSVLSTTPESLEPPAAQAPMVDPMRAVIEKRPKGGLPAVAEKIEYVTQDGQKTLYIVVSFISVPDSDTNESIERAIEFFMPIGQSDQSQQWITASMRLLSLAARGGFLERALSDMRKVVWDGGPVRLGTVIRADATEVPRWHDSEVAAIAYAIQRIIDRRRGISAEAGANTAPTATTSTLASTANETMAGRKCPECGAHAMIRKDGCDYCTACGHLGSCG